MGRKMILKTIIDNQDGKPKIVKIMNDDIFFYIFGKNPHYFSYNCGSTKKLDYERTRNVYPAMIDPFLVVKNLDIGQRKIN